MRFSSDLNSLVLNATNVTHHFSLKDSICYYDNMSRKCLVHVHFLFLLGKFFIHKHFFWFPTFCPLSLIELSSLLNSLALTNNKKVPETLLKYI